MHFNRYGLLTQMSHVAWSVCLYVGRTDVPCKTAELIDMPFGVGPRSHSLGVVKIPHGMG